jgi:hypothetical protein
MYQAMLISVNRKQEKNWIEAGMATPPSAAIFRVMELQPPLRGGDTRLSNGHIGNGRVLKVIECVYSVQEVS